MNNRKILRVAIVVISILLAYLPYSSEYNIKPIQSDIERGIEEFTNKNITIIDFKEVDNTMAVYYTLGTNDSIGFTALHKGINARYQIRSAGYNSRNRAIQGESFKTNSGDFLAVIGTNYDGKIASLKFKTYTGQTFSEIVQDQSEILMVFKTESPSNIEDYQLYDIDGKDITEEMETYLTTRESMGTGIGKAELFMLYIYCFIIILIGYGISGVFKDVESKKPKETTQ
jgi:hypothetical protein